MININNKTWDKLNATDIQELLNSADDETFFFEFKKDDVDTKKFVEEVSAFANTYGGYILIGVEDDKSISGCHQWNEEKVHTVIHDCITPTPTFDIKKFEMDKETIIVVKIEEGNAPPYITNKGKIYERLSSGSYVIKTSEKLNQLYNKSREQLKRIENKINVVKLTKEGNPKNVYGSLDLGFSITCTSVNDIQERFFSFDYTKISDFIKAKKQKFSISKVGHSYVISIGEINSISDSGKILSLKSGVNNYMEILPDGSVKCRVLMISKPDLNQVNIVPLFYVLYSIFREIYHMIFGQDFYKYFICAHKYEKLTVLNQFVPYYDVDSIEEGTEFLKGYLSKHKSKYGNNLIIEDNRIPKNDFTLIDKRYFDSMEISFDNHHLIEELFGTRFFNLGYIDNFEIDGTQNDE